MGRDCAGIRSACPMPKPRTTQAHTILALLQKDCAITPGRANNSPDCLHFRPFESPVSRRTNKNNRVKRLLLLGGNDGIRTHVTLRSTAFRVRLVTTTSIRFHVYHIVCLQLYYFITPRRAARYVRLLRCQGHPPRSLGRQTVH